MKQLSITMVHSKVNNSTSLSKALAGLPFDFFAQNFVLFLSRILCCHTLLVTLLMLVHWPSSWCYYLEDIGPRSFEDSGPAIKWDIVFTLLVQIWNKSMIRSIFCYTARRSIANEDDFAVKFSVILAINQYFRIYLQNIYMVTTIF